MMNAEEQKNMTNEGMTELDDSNLDDVTGGKNIVVIKSPKAQSDQAHALGEQAESNILGKIRGEID